MATYTTIQGDKWDSVCYKTLGSAAYVDRLMMLNPEYLGYYLFPAGIVLTLPEITVEDGVSASSLPPWKEAVG